MNPKLKNDIKEWLELIAMTAVSSVLVLHVNGMFSPKKDKDAVPQKTEVVKPAAPKDTVAQHALNNARQLKR